MRGELHAAVAVPDFQIRVMILDVCNVSERVYEAHRPVEVLELELPPDRGSFLRQHPARGQLAEQLLGFRVAKGRDAPFAGLAPF